MKTLKRKKFDKLYAPLEEELVAMARRVSHDPVTRPRHPSPLRPPPNSGHLAPTIGVK